MTNDARSSVPSTIVLETVNEGGFYRAKNGNARKPTKAETDKRITLLFNLLRQGLRRHEILQYCHEQTTWGIKDSAIDKMIAKATALLHKIAAKDRKTFFGIAVARLDAQYLKADTKGNTRDAIAATVALINLTGINGFNGSANLHDPKTSQVAFDNEREELVRLIETRAQRQGMVLSPEGDHEGGDTEPTSSTAVSVAGSLGETGTTAAAG